MDRVFCSRIRALRGSKSQAEFAKLLGDKQQNYARWEQGSCEPNFDLIRKISRTFGVSYCWLFEADNFDTSSLRHPSCMDAESDRSKLGIEEIKNCGKNSERSFRVIDAKTLKEKNPLPDSEAKNEIIKLLTQHNKEQASTIQVLTRQIEQKERERDQLLKQVDALIGKLPDAKPSTAATHACGAHGGNSKTA